MQTSDYLTQLQQDKSNLVDNLIEKGVEASNEETFTTLVPKVLDIESGGGDYNATMLTETIGSFGNGKNIEVLIKSIPKINIKTTSTSYMFQYCTSLTTIPELDTSKVTDMRYMFQHCTSLTTIPELDTSKVTDMSYMFQQCSSLTSIPQLNTSSCTNFYYMFYWCYSITTIPQLDTSSCNNVGNMFNNCYALTNFGGLLNLGQAYSTTQSANYNNYKLNLSNNCYSLTHDSLMNVINGLYDIATKGCNTQSLVLGSINLAKLTEEEIAIATNKGWTVS